MTGVVMSADGRISTVEVAVLAERVDRMLTDYSELRGLILAQNASLSQIPLINQNILELSEKTNRIFTKLGTQDNRISVLEKTQNTQSFILRVAGVILLSCIGLLGWGWREGKDLYRVDNIADRRLLLLEYKLGIQPPTVDAGK